MNMHSLISCHQHHILAVTVQIEILLRLFWVFRGTLNVTEPGLKPLVSTNNSPVMAPCEKSTAFGPIQTFVSVRYEPWNS